MPMHDVTYADARTAWLSGFDLWRQGRRPEQLENPDASWVKGRDWWEYESPPDRDSYRPEFSEEPTWIQVYETVSEGTPVTPPFSTKKALVEYLVQHGDFWRQNEGRGGFSREAAEAFVDSGSVLSMVVVDGRVIEGIDSAALFP